jgi:hypothetical protein
VTISSKQLREAARLIHQMLQDGLEGWTEQHLTVWRNR